MRRKRRIVCFTLYSTAMPKYDFFRRIRQKYFQRKYILLLVAVRMSGMPLPSRRYDALEAIVLRLPSEFSLYLLARSDEGCRIAGSASFDRSLYWKSRHFFGDVDDLFDAESVAVADVVMRGFSAVFEIIQSANMGVRKIGDMDIISHASAVGSGIIVAENADMISRAVCHLQMMGIRWDSGLCASPISPLL